jgi:hypothetical protein
MKIIYVDIDETICTTPQSRKYEDAQPIFSNIEKINELYEKGNTIVYWTSRGSRKQIDWYELTYKQLVLWGARFHELRVDKPYYDLFIDDKTLRIEEI